MGFENGVEYNNYLTDEDFALFERVVAIYKEKESIRDTAIKTELSRSKVRKILITMGVMASEITDQALELINRGMTIKQAAEELGISTGTLSTYLPYGKRVQGREERSDDAIRSENYRARQARAAMNQVRRGDKDPDKSNSVEELAAEVRSVLSRQACIDMKEEDVMVVNRAENSIENNVMNSIEDTVINNLVNSYRVYKLHLELDTEHADMEVLKKWGKVKNGISRDILVSSRMTLHALHYAIQKCFGWENSHLHHYEFPKETMDALINNRFTEYCRYCGMYFRFPYGDSEAVLDDIYWDDDYEAGESFKSWLKRKYSPPFRYEGSLELYLMAQHHAQDFVLNNKVLRIGPSFEEYMNGKTEHRLVLIEDASYDEMYDYFECSTGELIERMQIGEALRTLGEYKSPEGDLLDLPASLKYADDLAAKSEAAFTSDWEELLRLDGLADKIDMVEDKLRRSWKRKNPDPVAILAYREEAERLNEEYEDGMDKLFKRTQPELPPLAESLLYKYDYGDGWHVKITVSDEYRMVYTDEELTGFVNSQGEEVDDEFLKTVCQVLFEGAPLCLEADGLPVMDDVGGVYGYCEFLKGIHGKENNGPYDDPKESKEWARALGWTGRMSKPKNIL